MKTVLLRTIGCISVIAIICSTLLSNAHPVFNGTGNKIVSPKTVSDATFSRPAVNPEAIRRSAARKNYRPGSTVLNDQKAGFPLFTPYSVGVTKNCPTATATVTFSGSSKESFVVPAGVTSVTIQAIGGAGGNAESGAGGNGASMQASFSVVPSETLSIIVGQKGGDEILDEFDKTFALSAGGGGGTFVTRTNDSFLDLSDLMIVAGGGGGGGLGSALTGYERNANTGEAGFYGADVAGSNAFGIGGAGGTGGNGGSGGSGSAGGGGFLTDGHPNFNSLNPSLVVTGSGGSSPRNGGYGGNGPGSAVYPPGEYGGYGGGGASISGGGGGGGYSGGGGGFNKHFGGGGGSYYSAAATNKVSSMGSLHNTYGGDGVVIITWTLPTPVISASGNSPVNIGNAINLSSTAGFTSYAWTGPNGYVSTDQNPIIASAALSDAGSYSVTGKDVNGCLATNSTNVVVNAAIPPAAALNFDGSNDFIEINAGGAAATNFSTASSFTIETWVKPNSVAGLSTLFGHKFSTASTPGYSFCIADGKLYLEGTSSGAVSTGTVAANVWSHVAMVYKAGSVTFYINGIASGTFPGVGIVQPATIKATLGTFNNGLYFYNGTMDEFRIWNRALCQAELRNNMNCETPGVVNGLLVDYHFNQGLDAANNTSITSVTDATPNNYHAAISTPTFTLNGAVSNFVAPGAVVTGSACTPFVAAVSPITGAGGVCSGSILPLANATSGVGTWSSSDATIASVNTSGVVSGIKAGSVIITYTSDCGATTTATVTVNAVPSAIAYSVVDNCNGTSTVTALNVTGTLLWSTGSSLNPVSVSIAGNISATQTLNGCTSPFSFVPVSPKSAPAAPGINLVDNCNGTSTLTATGILGTLHWSHTASTAPTQVVNTAQTISLYQTVATCNSQPFTVTTAPKSFPAKPGVSVVNNCDHTSTLTAVGTGLIWSTGATAATIFVSIPQTYSVTQTVNGCTSSPNSVTAAPNTKPLAPSVTGASRCGAGRVTLNATPGTGGDSIDWYDAPTGGTLVGAGASFATPSLLVTTTYYAESKNSTTGCVSAARAAVTATINSSLGVTANHAGAGCENDLIRLFTVPGDTYSWTGPGGFVSSEQNPTIPNSTLNHAGTYTVTVTDASGCSGTASTIVVVNELPTIAASSNSPVCEGGILTLSASGGVSYSWTGPMGDLSGDNPQVSNVSIVNGGTYYVKGTGANGCRNDASVLVQVNVKPRDFTMTGGGATCTKAIQFDLNGSEPGVVYQLIFNGNTNLGAPVAGTGGPITFPLQIVPGAYTVLATNSATHCASLMNSGNPNLILPGARPNNVPVFGGGITCRNGAIITMPFTEPGIEYQLFFNYTTPVGAPIPSFGGPVTFPGQSQPGAYTVEAVNPITGCTATMNSGSAVLVSAGTPPTNYSIEGGGFSCKPGGVEFKLLGSDAGVYYQLLLDGNNTGEPIAGTGGVISFGYQGAEGAYTVLATQTFTGCYAIMASGQPTFIFHADPPNAPVGTDASRCDVGNITLTATAGPGETIDWYPAATGGVPVLSGSNTLVVSTSTVFYAEARNTTTGCVSGTRTPVTATMNQGPTINPASNGPVCAGQPINLFVNAGAVYEWTGPKGLLFSNLQNPVIFNATLANTGLYQVTVTDVNGCRSNASVSVIVNALPIASAGSNGPVCENAALNLSAASGPVGTLYAWSGPNSFSSSDQNPSISSHATLADAGLYTVNISDANGCRNSASVNVAVNTLPVVTIIAAGGITTVCAPGSVILSAASPSSGSSYLWAHGPQSQSINLFSSGTYTVTVTDPAGCKASASQTVSVNAQPAKFNISGGGAYCNGGTGFAVTLSGSELGMNYELLLNSIPTGQIIAGTGAGISFGNQAAAGVYNVAATNPSTHCASTMNGAATITVRPLPAVFTVSGGGGYCTGGPGASVTLSNVENSVNYMLFVNGVASVSQSGSAGSSITFFNQTTVGTYTIVASNPITGCTMPMSGSVNVFANPKPVLSTVATAALCFAGNTGAVNLTVSSGTPPFIYSWSNGAATEDISGLAGNNNYTVTVIDAAGCTATASAFVSRPVQLAFTQTSAHNTCFGGTTGSITITANGGSGSNQYSINNGASYQASNVFANLGAGNYNVVVKDVNNCTSNTQAVNISQPSQINFSSSVTNVSCFGGNTGSVNISANGGTGGANTNYTWNSPTDFDVSANTIPTANNVSSLSIGAGNGYIHSHGGSVTLTIELFNAVSSTWVPVYTTTITNSAQLNLSGITATFAPIPQVTQIRFNSNPAQGSSFHSVSSLPITIGGSSYTYAINGGAFQSSNIFNNLAAGTYSFVVKDANNCTSAPQNATVNQPPLLTAGISNNTAVTCPGGNNGSATVTAGGGTAPYTYAWSPSGGNAATANGLSAGNYTVTVTDAKGCTKAVPVTIIQSDPVNPVALVKNVSRTITTASGPYTVTVTDVDNGSFDNCAITQRILTGTLTFDCSTPSGTYPVTLTVSDATGHTAFAVAMVTIINACNRPPVAGCVNMVLNTDPNGCTVAVTAQQVAANSSDPDNDPLVYSITPAGPYPVGTTTVTVTVTDPGGLSATCTSTITVEDKQLPVINCPASVTRANTYAQCGAIYVWAMPTATDNCGTPGVVLIAGLPSGSFYPLGTTTNILEATDASGNKKTCSFTVTIVDNQPPFVLGPIPPATQTVACDAVPPMPVLTANDNCDAAATMTFTETKIPGSCAGNYTLVRKWVARDNANNSSIIISTITVRDTKAPVITCPSNIVVGNDAGTCGAVVSYAATAVDACSSATVTYNILPGTVFAVGTHTVIATATDDCGNAASCSFTVTVNDEENPVLSGIPLDIMHDNDPGDCGAMITWALPTATDNCPGVILSSDHHSGESFPVGGTRVTYTALDVHGRSVTGSFTITIEDKEDPIITVPGDVNHAADAGKCSFTFATPGGGNQSSNSNSPGSGAASHMPKPVYLGIATATDNCGMVTVSGVRSDGLPLDEAYPVGVTTITWTATDSHARSFSGGQTITITDEEEPVITGTPADFSQPSDDGACGAIVTWTPPAATDNCPGVILRSNHTPGELLPFGPTTVTYTAEDVHGHSVETSFVITVTDEQRPIFAPFHLIVVADADLNACTAAVTIATPAVTDNCTLRYLAGVRSDGAPITAPYPIGHTLITWTAIDAAGNSTVVTQDIFITDTQVPKIECPENIVVYGTPGLNGANITYAATATDNCGMPALSYSIGSGSFFAIGTTTHVTVEARDASGLPASCSFTVTVLNNPPMALPDVNTTLEDTPVSGNVLTNDTDLDGNALSVTGFEIDGTPHAAGETVLMPGIGSLQINANGGYTFTPAPDYNGPVPVATYTIADVHEGTASASLTISIIPVDDAPVAVDDAAAVNEDEVLHATVAGNDTESGDGNNNWTVLTTTSNGTLVLHADGTYTYTPNANFHGTDVFTYHVCDGDEDCAEAKVTITVNSVNDVPVAVDDAVSVNEDAVLNATVIENDTESGDAGNTWENITSPTNGTLVFNSDGTYTYTPNANFHGTDGFIYKLCDANGDCVTAKVTITVNSVNDKPVAVDDAATVNEDEVLHATVAGNDTESGDGNNAWKVLTTTSHGTLLFNADGSYTYTPNPNFNSSDFFIYELCDGENDCSKAIVKITVISIDDAPKAVKDVVSVDEDGILNATVTGNDTESGDGGNAWSLLSGPSHGTLTFLADGTYTYTPAANFNGTDTFIYQVCDADNDCSKATVTITVNSVNDVPVAKNDAVTINEDAVLHSSVAGNDTPSGDGGNVYGVLNGTSHGILILDTENGTYTYTPNANFNGTDEFIYQLCDADGDCRKATVTITVLPVEDPSIVKTRDIVVYVDANGHVSITPEQIDNGSTDADGIASLSLDKKEFSCNTLGPNMVILTVTDVNNHSATGMATVTVIDNTPPVITCPAPVTVQCTSAVPAPDPAAVFASDNCSAVITFVEDVITGRTSADRYTINRTYQATDPSGNATTCTQIITVRDNTAPVAVCKSISVTLVNGVATITPASINNGSYDNCSAVTLAISTAVFNCTNLGNNTVTLTVTDASGNSSSCQAIVTVLGVTPSCTIASVPTANTYTGGVSTSLYLGYGAQGTTLKVTAPAAGAPYTYSWSGSNTEMLSSTTGASPVFTPTKGGSYTFTVTTKNSFGCSSTCSITICVTDIRVLTLNTSPGNDDDDHQSMCNHASHDASECSHKGHNHNACDHKAHSKYTCAHRDNDDEDNDQKDCDHKSHDSKDCSHKGHNHKTCDHRSHSKYDCDHDKSKGSDEKVCDHKSHDSKDCSHSGHHHGECSHKTHTSTTCPHNGGHGDDDDDNDNDNKKVYLCHVPPGNPGKTLTLSISVNAVAAHLANHPGDRLGSCEQQPCSGYFDNTKPEIDCPGNVTVNTGASTQPSATGAAEAEDNSGSVSIGYTDVSTKSATAGTRAYDNYIITRTWKATDPSGNHSECIQVITVQDVTRPVITCPGNVVATCSAGSTGVATATDNSTGPIVINYTDGSSYHGSFVRTWKATDVSGNYSTCSQTITVSDNIKPVISDPADITVSCGGSILPANTGSASATDNCSTVIVTYTDVVSGNVITRTWKATDASGNYSTAVQLITQGIPFTTNISSVPANSTYTGGVSTNLYIGYGAQSTTLQVGSLPSSGAPYTYIWSGTYAGKLNSTSSSAPVLTPVTGGTYAYTVLVTNKYGCTYAAGISICVTDIKVPGTNGAKVYVCHTPSGKYGTPQTQQVLLNQVSSHIGSSYCGGSGNDRLGSCEQSPCGAASANSTGGAVLTATKEGGPVTEVSAVTTEEELKVTVMPNPSTTFFTLKLESRFETPVNMRVMDGRGRVVDARTKIGANSTFQIGHNYSSGTYYAELVQGTKRKVVQLIKGRG